MKYKHANPEVQRAITKLADILCSWERSTGIESVLIIREAGFMFRAVSGKPGIPDDVTDVQLIKMIEENPKEQSMSMKSKEAHEMMKCSIQKIKHRECYMISESDYGKAEIWKVNNIYILFGIPQYGGVPVYYRTYCEHGIDEMVEEIQSWT